jgi:hypothetical protein
VKPLFIPLTGRYFDQFLGGTKPNMEELRPYGPRWNEQTCQIGRPVVLSRGYGRRHRIQGRIVGFRTSHTEAQRPEYLAIYAGKHAGMPAACIKIELEKRG